MIVAITTPAMGHVKPMMPLLRGFVDGGHEVVCFGHKAFEATIRATGAAFRPYPEVPYDIDAPDFNLVRMAADLILASEILYPALLPQVAALGPRLILQDFMACWGSRIGTTLGVPRVHTVPTIVFNAEARRQMRQEDGPLKLASDVARGAPSLLRALMRSRFALSVGEAYGLDGSWRRLAPPVAELVFSLRALQVGEPDGGVPRHYIGPIVDPHRRFAASSFTPGYALVTFGTLSNTQTARFEAAMEGAFRAGLPVVVQCGGKVDTARLRDHARALETAYPGQWAEIVETVADMEPLILGAAVVVHHAGMATTWETVRFRRPALMIPTIADQKVLAGRLSALGVGLRLPPGRETDAVAIARALEKVLVLDCPWDDVSASITHAGGAAHGVQLILDVLGTLA